MKEENPWNIETLYDFLFFNCPSCTYKNNSKQKFVDHAVQLHPESSQFLLNLKDSSINDVNFVQEFLKCEFAAENLTSDPSTQEFLKVELEEFKINTDDADEEIQNYDYFETLENDEAHDEDLKDDLDPSYFRENDFTKNDKIGKKKTNAKKKTNGRKKTNQITKCEYCEASYPRKDHVFRHMRSKHREKLEYKCDECDELFATEKYLKFHYGSQHEDLNKIKCKYCQESFGTTKKLKCHMMRIHKTSPKFNKFSNEQPKVKCEKCSKYFFKNYLHTHMTKLHSEGVKRQCEKCGLDFENKSRLSEHLNLVHREQNKEACHICHKGPNHLLR